MSEPVDVNGNIHYPFPLGSGGIAHLALPPNLDAEDAERLVEFVQSLAVRADVALLEAHRG